MMCTCVRSPAPAGRWRVSTEGGIYPRWSATTHELLFLNQNTESHVRAVRRRRRIRSAPTSRRSGRRPSLSAAGGPLRTFAVRSPSGRQAARRLAAQDQGGSVQDKVVFVFNFFDYLRKIAPEKE